MIHLRTSRHRIFGVDTAEDLAAAAVSGPVARGCDYHRPVGETNEKELLGRAQEMATLQAREISSLEHLCCLVSRGRASALHTCHVAALHTSEIDMCGM